MGWPRRGSATTKHSKKPRTWGTLSRGLLVYFFTTFVGSLLPWLAHWVATWATVKHGPASALTETIGDWWILLFVSSVSAHGETMDADRNNAGNLFNDFTKLGAYLSGVLSFAAFGIAQTSELRSNEVLNALFCAPAIWASVLLSAILFAFVAIVRMQRELPIEQSKATEVAQDV
jgi:hypothetical protein